MMQSFGLRLIVEVGGTVLGYLILVFVVGVICGCVLKWYFQKRRVM